jgi:Replication-relaxation
VKGERRVGSVGIIQLRQSLSDRDLSILERVGSLRLLCAHQIQALLFSDDRHATPATAARTCRRTLERLTRHGLLVRLDRRVGGVRSGSASFVYALTSLGQRVIRADGPRRRLAEPSERFVEHTLAVADVFVQISVHARQLGWELLSWQSEPDCWRAVNTLGGRIILRPDFYVVLDVDGYELRWFVEIDRATEHLPAITRKCRLYHSYYKGGHEQRLNKVFPRVLWVVPSENRLDRVRAIIDADRRLTADLFRVATDERMLTAIGASE